MKRKNRFLLPALAVLVGIAIYQYAVVFIRSEMNSIREMQSTKMKTLEKYVTFIAQKQEIENRIAVAKDLRRAADAKLVDGQTASVAAANLQNSLKGVVTAQRGTISSLRAEKPEEKGRFTGVSVTLDAVLPDIRAVIDTLYSIETQNPTMIVNELDMRTKDYRDPRELIVRLKVSGLTVASK
ncbi:MAG: type II secretion system protein GspM [Syntrophales bacterium LBB04]|nr:type II secretion system protein GspM [Syntrophales bacterium LBB04]